MLPLDKKLVLIVEDEPFIALDLAKAIADGGDGRWSGADVREADEVLDSDIGAAMMWPIAQRLHDKGVPFVFVSARYTQAELPEPFGGYQCISNPARQCDLVERLSHLTS